MTINKTKLFFLAALMVAGMQWSACIQGPANEEATKTADTTVVNVSNSDTISDATIDSTQVATDKSQGVNPASLSTVLVYNFHVTNRCPSCIAIEEATTKTLNTYFAKEVKQGRIKRQILNVDDEANSKIAEKYQAFGSGMFVTRVYKGKETTTDLTGDGFKFAKNKEERFIEILKNKIQEYLK